MNNVGLGVENSVYYTISTLAGTGSPGYSGDGQNAASAQMNLPSGVTVDSYGNVYIADFANHRIRKVGSNGLITTLAGTGSPGFSCNRQDQLNGKR